MMIKRIWMGMLLAFATFMVGCASVPMASVEDDEAAKRFELPPPDKAGLYVFRNTSVGQAIKRQIKLDGVAFGRTANKVYFYKEMEPGEHVLGTESEFSDNTVTFKAEGGQLYFAEQYIKMGFFAAGANVRFVDDEKGKEEVLNCNLAVQP